MIKKRKRQYKRAYPTATRKKPSNIKYIFTLFYYTRAETKNQSKEANTTMKIKSYHIASPEQLNELGVFAKDTERLKQIRSVWSIALRKKGKTPWDHAIFA